jgi:hypothetical protein
MRDLTFAELMALSDSARMGLVIPGWDRGHEPTLGDLLDNIRVIRPADADRGTVTEAQLTAALGRPPAKIERVRTMIFAHQHQDADNASAARPLNILASALLQFDPEFDCAEMRTPFIMLPLSMWKPAERDPEADI